MCLTAPRCYLRLHPSGPAYLAPPGRLLAGWWPDWAMAGGFPALGIFLIVPGIASRLVLLQRGGAGATDLVSEE